MNLKDSFNLSALLPNLAETELLKWFESLTKSASTVYDKALDMDYLKTHIGGKNHRMFDGGHDIFSAWDRAKDALPDDTFSQEVIGYVSALWKDVTTTKGLPFATIDKAKYDDWAEAVSSWNIPGLDKGYLYDLLSFDVIEIMSSAFGAFGVVFALKKEDKEKLAEILGSMGIVGIISANPIMGMVTIGLTFYSYKIKKIEMDKESAFKGGFTTIVTGFLFSALGLPFILDFVLVVLISRLLKKHLLDKKDVRDYFKSNIKKFFKELKNNSINGSVSDFFGKKFGFMFLKKESS